MSTILERWVNDLAAQHTRARLNQEAIARQHCYAIDPVAAAKFESDFAARTFLYQAGHRIPTDAGAVQRLVRQYASIPPPPPAEHRCAWCGGWSATQLCPHCGGPR